MLLEVSEVKYTYMPGTPFEVKALQGVSLQVERGEFVGIMGSTGSGKSTLLQHLNGLLEPTAGTVKVNGKPVKAGSIQEEDVCVGLVFQHPEQQLFAETVFQEVAFGPVNQGLSPGEVRERVEEALEKVEMDLSGIMDRSPFELSRGQMRRIALAGVLAMRPQLLILDEPTSGLDPEGRSEFLEYIAHLHQKLKLTLIMVSHRPAELIPHANRILVMHGGKIRLEGAPAEVFSRPQEIQEIGLELPPPVELLLRLRREGFPVEVTALTEEEACREIAAKISGGGDNRES